MYLERMKTQVRYKKSYFNILFHLHVHDVAVKIKKKKYSALKLMRSCLSVVIRVSYCIA